MAIASGVYCINCNKVLARPMSHYCSEECSERFVKRKRGPVDCARCGMAVDSVAEAKKAKWTEIEEDAEGFSWNYTGVCPDCQRPAEVKQQELFQGEK